ncbi:hypothetical protein HXX76_004834 [Chlamydomonas incerta]|uniref:BACK domain-containing protein n=1 Tax=Chlamydomonas incerta TaxID=51695 RepID=A0A835W4W7_CHLIN|nr:hypothetical protein HXX76_004834 [Chlamydomonas incerta]|eukprot:KAG2439480.1 hypothetical protein HXX76_004834 [Chlamydomonas incerta]
MSQAVRRALARRFGSAERSDCEVLFFLETPLEGTAAAPASSSAPTVSSASPPQALATDASGRVLLYVGLWCPKERPLAEALLRFLYSGDIDLTTVSDLLRARPIALRLAIEGGVEACDSALQMLTASQSARGAHARSFVEELWTCRGLLPEPASSAGADPTGPALRQALMAACRSAMARHCQGEGEGGDMAAPGLAAGPAAGPAAAAGLAAARPAAAGPAAGASPSVGELLGFAFEDALAVLNDGVALRQLQSLPAAALEALLASEGFGTDDEASIVLLLAEWHAANAATAAQGDTMRLLLRHIRWAHVSSDFLSYVAPRVAWLGVSWEHAAWLSAYTRAPCDNYRQAMLQQEYGSPGEHAEYAARLRAPCRPAARPLGVRPFSVAAEEATKLDEARMLSTGTRTFAMGLAWHVYLKETRSAWGAAFPGKDVTMCLRKGDDMEQLDFGCGVRAVGIGAIAGVSCKASDGEDAAQWWAQYLRDGRLVGEVVWSA